MPIRIVIADDHLLYRETLCRMLRSYPAISVLGEASSGAEAIQLAAHLQPDVALVDVRIKNKNGLDAIAAIRDQSIRTAVLMLSIYEDKQYVIRAVLAGARGYLLKDADIDLVVRAIGLLHGGEYYFSPAISAFAEEAFERLPGSVR